MVIDFTTEEAKALIGLLDVATKAGGLEVAQHAIPLALKVQKALNDTEEQVSE